MGDRSADLGDFLVTYFRALRVIQLFIDETVFGVSNQIWIGFVFQGLQNEFSSLEELFHISINISLTVLDFILLIAIVITIYGVPVDQPVDKSLLGPK